MATDITFYDNYEAALPAGNYKFVLQQSVNLEGDAPRHYYRDQSFEVLAPRYAIDTDDIQAYFPPNGGVADYTNTLPHLVLGSRNLPWERRPGRAGEPWLALLVISEHDIAGDKAVFKTGTIADLVPQNKTTAQWTRTEEGKSILLPMFNRLEDLKTPVRLLDLDLNLFRTVCPSREELPFLAHIRQVNIADKVPLEMVANGDFSVLVANRFPPLGASTVYLVSLEGWTQLLDTPASTSASASRLRLITFADWNFVNDPAGHDTFGGLMKQLKNNSRLFGVKLPASTGVKYVDNALERAYVPLDYKPLDSTQTFAWYRGPLAPLTRNRLTETVFERADAAMIFDQAKGILDLSYASAWELGRLLALSSPAFAKGLRLFIEGRQNAAEFAREIEAFLQLHSSSFVQPPSGDTAFEQVRIADELVEWIARLVLLYPVPFHYLVPHQSLLPSESLRFFHLDDNWVNALVDGAFSIAVRDVATERKALRTELQETLSQIVYQHRLRLQGQSPAWKPSESYMSVPKSGFLLRSRIVTGWPGVEITVKTSARPDPNLPAILRFDQISDGVLFCLARDVIQEVTFREPLEGLSFGVGSDGKVTAKKTGQSVDVKTGFIRAGSGGVLDITKLQQQLTSADSGGVLDSTTPQQELTSGGSAQFAINMIREPEEQSIAWRSNS